MSRPPWWWIPGVAGTAGLVFFSLNLLSHHAERPPKPFVPPPAPVRRRDVPVILPTPPIAEVNAAAPLSAPLLLAPVLPPAPPADLWDIRLQSIRRSSDRGRTWQEVRVADRVAFEAVAAMGPEVWAGGSGGALFHSGDRGRHWTKIPVFDGRAALDAAITTISAVSAVEVRLGTAAGEQWITADGGLHWRRDPRGQPRAETPGNPYNGH